MAKLTSSIGTAGMNAGAKVIARMMRISDIKTDAQLAGLFQIKNETLEAITFSMKTIGYDKAEPIVIWKGKNLVVDGYTRLKAAIEAGFTEIPVEEKEFSSLEDAAEYSKKRQRDRRNLSQAEIMAAASKLENKAVYDGNGRGSEILAKELGISPSTIQHARTVLTSASPEVVEQVKQNKLSINKAYKATREINSPMKTMPKEKMFIKFSINLKNNFIVDSNLAVRQFFTELFTLLSLKHKEESIPQILVEDITEALKPFTGENFYHEINANNSNTLAISDRGENNL